MPKIILTKEQIIEMFSSFKESIYATGGRTSITYEPPEEYVIEISNSQIVSHEPTNVEKWEKWLNDKWQWSEFYHKQAYNIAEELTRLGYDATPAYNEVMKDG